MSQSHRLPDNAVPQRYKIWIRPDFEKFTFAGKETIDLQITQPSSGITLNASDLDIQSARYSTEDGKVLEGKVGYDKEAERVTFVFEETLVEGPGKLEIEYTGQVREDLRGFYRSKYTSKDGADHYLAVTQFEATDARKAFPCWDEPDKKAVFDVTLVMPPHMKAISNNIEKNVSVNENGENVFEFESTPKMSTYLLALLVGEFESVEERSGDGVLHRVFTTPGRSELGRFALGVSIKVLKFYEEYTGIPYPLKKMDMIAIPDFAAGAMENWGAVTYRENALLIDPENSSQAARERVTEVIAHEDAHMWFGDLATMKWWTHLWLNEGFASFMSYLGVDHAFPEWDVWSNFVSDTQSRALSLDALKNTHPVEIEVGHPREVDEIFDNISYEKGASINYMLWRFVGEEPFRRGLSKYLKEHSYANAQTEDLWKAIGEESGQPVEELMKNWTSRPGYPLISVREEGDSLVLSQERFFSSPQSRQEAQDTTLWQVPLVVSEEGLEKRYLMKENSLSISKPESGKWLVINSGAGSFVRIDYPGEYLERLKTPLEEQKLSPVDRYALVRDAFDLARAGMGRVGKALALVQNYKKETNFTVWSAVAEKLSLVGGLIDEEDYLEDFKAFGRETFREIAQKMGWEKKDGETNKDTFLRSLVHFHLGRFGDTDTISEARRRFALHVSKEAPLSADLRGFVYALVAENGEEKEYDELIKLYMDTDLQEEKTRIMAALGNFKSPEIIEKTLKFAFSDLVRSQDTFRVVSSVWSNPKGRDRAWQFTKDNWTSDDKDKDTLLKRYGNGGQMLGYFVQSASVFHSKESAKDIEEFFRTHKAPSAERSVLQTVEAILSKADWLERDREAIRNFLKK